MASMSREKVSQSIITLHRPYTGLLAALIIRKGLPCIIFDKTTQLSALTATRINILCWKNSSDFTYVHQTCLWSSCTVPDLWAEKKIRQGAPLQDFRKTTILSATKAAPIFIKSWKNSNGFFYVQKNVPLKRLRVARHLSG